MKKYCHTCHREMVSSHRDGRYCRDGSMNRSGYVCPSCATKSVADGLEYLKETAKVSTDAYDLSVQCLNTIAPLLKNIFALPQRVKDDAEYTFKHELDTTPEGIHLKSSLSKKPRIFENDVTRKNLSGISSNWGNLTIGSLIVLLDHIETLLSLGDRMIANQDTIFAVYEAVKTLIVAMFLCQ